MYLHVFWQVKLSDNVRLRLVGIRNVAGKQDIGREVLAVDLHDIVRVGSAFNSRFCAFSRQMISTPVGQPEDNPTGEQDFHIVPDFSI